MEKYQLVDATVDHAEALAPMVCEADAEEVWVSTRIRPLEALRMSLHGSAKVKTGLLHGEPVLMAGVGNASFLGDIYRGIPWMLGSDVLRQHGTHFLRASRAFVQEIADDYALLENYVDVRNKQSIRWLGWLGFTLDEPAPYGYEQLLFQRFWMEGNKKNEELV